MEMPTTLPETTEEAERILAGARAIIALGKVAGMKEDAAAVFGLFELSTMIIIELIKLRNRVRELEQ